MKAVLKKRLDSEQVQKKTVIQCVECKRYVSCAQHTVSMLLI